MYGLKKGTIVSSPVSGRRYRVGPVLGEGGFGRAYKAQELNRRNKVVDDVCLKTTVDQTSWHRESYFGELLSKNKRVIQTLDSFPLAPKNGSRRRLLFCLVLELAQHGTVADYLEKNERPWTVARAKREIIALLKVLDQLHGASATHRDLTPMNVFVCGNGTLKLGDFGTARHQLAAGPKTIDAFNPGFVTRGFLDDHHRHWLAVDDVFQMGQLFSMLLRGDADTLVTPAMVNQIEGCPPQLKKILRQAVGPRSKRYADAFELMQALLGNEGGAESKISSLENKTVVFTGPMGMSRFEAEVLVLQSGGNVSRNVSKKVDVIVQGGRARHYKNGHRGSKLQHAEKLIKQGHRMHVIGETEFRRLVRSEAKV